VAQLLPGETWDIAVDVYNRQLYLSILEREATGQLRVFRAELRQLVKQ
jgi:hypothetical protein